MENEAFVVSADKARPAEENEENAEDWTDLERFQHFITSEYPLRRLVCVRGLAETMGSVSVGEAIEVALPLLAAVSNDDESSVRDALSTQMAPMLKSLIPRADDDQAELIMNLSWPVSMTLLRDKDQQVRAGSTVLLIWQSSVSPHIAAR